MREREGRGGEAPLAGMGLRVSGGAGDDKHALQALPQDGCVSSVLLQLSPFPSASSRVLRGQEGGRSDSHMD